MITVPVRDNEGMTEQPQLADNTFRVHLEVFEGPFDLLLGLISKHKLDITEVSLSQVTDEFISYIRARGPQWDLEQTSHFLLVAATLLDLKAARLLPSGEVDDEEDLALLEARDLLFARLLQYRAYKEVAKVFSARMAEEALRFPRTVPMEAPFADLLPELILGIGPDRLAQLAQRAFAPKAPRRSPSPTFTNRSPTSRIRRLSLWSGCGGCAGRPSGPSPPTAQAPSRSSRVSWPSWSSTGRRPSPSTRWSPSENCT